MVSAKIKNVEFPPTLEKAQLPTSTLLDRLTTSKYHHFYQKAGLQPPASVKKGWAISPNNSPYIISYPDSDRRKESLLVVRRNLSQEMKRFFPRSYPDDIQERALLVSSLIGDKGYIIPEMIVRNSKTGELHLASRFEPAMITLRDWLKTVCKYDAENHRAPEFYTSSREFLTSLFTPQSISDLHKLIATAMIFHLEDIQGRNVGFILNQEGEIERLSYFDHKLSFYHLQHENHGCYYLSPEKELLTGIRFGWEIPRANPNLYSLPALVFYYTSLDIDPNRVIDEYHELRKHLAENDLRIQGAISAVSQPLQDNASHLLSRHLNGEYPVNEIIQSNGAILVNGKEPSGNHIFACIKHSMAQLRKLHYQTKQPLNTGNTRYFDIFTRRPSGYKRHFQRMGIETTPEGIAQPQILGYIVSTLMEEGIPIVDQLELTGDLYTTRTKILISSSVKNVLLVLPVAVLLANQLERIVSENISLIEIIQEEVLTLNESALSAQEEIIENYHLDELVKIGCFGGIDIYELPK